MDELGYKPTILSVGQAKEKAKEMSSRIFDMIGVANGKTTEPGPGVSECSEDPKRLYKVRHVWSVYGVSMGELSQGFDRVRQKLPVNGWKITQYGPNESKARDLRILADSSEDRYTVNIELLDGSKSGNAPSASKESGIMVSLVSACFRLPDGADLHGEY
ncbi:MULTISPECIES: hypothetical protein [Streptomyces]|uniref:Uncharacterized protein n=1 Tax=Streptomyces griseocarneus TaxID=51201 RepID=A0ABX7RJA7_9ACTN|nr:MULTISPECIES: hypothetical protein [Streptomyces]QSY47414.1 hypothetical protein J3S04_18990 [Streptomyces griseocarneus]